MIDWAIMYFMRPKKFLSKKGGIKRQINDAGCVAEQG